MIFHLFMIVFASPLSPLSHTMVPTEFACRRCSRPATPRSTPNTLDMQIRWDPWGTWEAPPSRPHLHTYRPTASPTESAFEACAGCTTTKRTQNTLDMQIRLKRWRVRGAARWVKQNKMGMIEEYLREYISLHNPPPFYDCFCLPPLTPLTHHGLNRICMSTLFWPRST